MFTLENLLKFSDLVVKIPFFHSLAGIGMSSTSNNKLQLERETCTKLCTIHRRRGFNYVKCSIVFFLHESTQGIDFKVTKEQTQKRNEAQQ